MSSPKEVEIKLELPGELKELPLSSNDNDPAQSEDLTSVYFDTDRLKLHKHGVTLRVRRVGDHYVQTIKASDGTLFERGEWEAEIGGDRPDLDVARGTALQSFIDENFLNELRPVFETRVRRSTYPLITKDYEIMLSVDHGSIDTGKDTIALNEAELELKRGSRAHLFRIARSLSRSAHADLAVKSKSQRGYELLDGYKAAVEKTDSVTIEAGMRTSDAFRLVASMCLKQVVANRSAVLASDPEGIHQMRVGLRRLRTAISLFSDIIPGKKTDDIKVELKWLTAELSPSRELDVFVNGVVHPLEGSAHSAELRPLAAELSKRRDAALERAKAAVCSQRFRNLTLNVAEWLEIGRWRRPQDMLLRERCEQPVEATAVAQLNRRWRKIRKRGRRLLELDATQRHKLRIQAKKVRYASEFFEALFPGKKLQKRQRKFVAAVKDIQNCLGDLNDISVHISRSKEIAAEISEATFAAGLVVGHEEAREAAVLVAAEQAHKSFSKARPYWK
ncbi:CHAD domain-containing protein [Bradyrhizobium sp. SYSU BS000235]|uniref:CYTH and CHAD domain-containing protein n=1 Tax=Bradyrhizobium sp. SYSU BS000235 TaxID=3411332 RepID=UPI003C71F082